MNNDEYNNIIRLIKLKRIGESKMKKYNVIFKFKHKGQILQFDLEELMCGCIDEDCVSEYELSSVTVK